MQKKQRTPEQEELHQKLFAEYLTLNNRDWELVEKGQPVPAQLTKRLMELHEHLGLGHSGME